MNLFHHTQPVVQADARAERPLVPSDDACVYLSFRRGFAEPVAFSVMTVAEARALAAQLNAAADQAELIDAERDALKAAA